jgi:hypothetical protein
MLAINLHNKLRSQVALGNGVNKNGTTLPKATNMYELTWNNTIEAVAQSWADQCNWSHNVSDGKGGSFGQNNAVQTYSGGFWNISAALDYSIRAWYIELERDGLDSLVLSTQNANHFTQVGFKRLQ